ncbi:DciA family protein [Streptomyces sp. NPDC102274]|uniref:DciA family protein n=1 Tax=Streptomyces sp. NPDC102274 TaxID=3366151 RepID=UPI0038109EE9
MLQFLLGLSERQAAEAVRCRIDFGCAPAMELDDPGFHHGVPAGFRECLAQGVRADRLLGLAPVRLKDAGLVCGRGTRRSGTRRTDSTHVLAAVCDLIRLELISEAVRAVLEVTAGTASHLLATTPYGCLGISGSTGQAACSVPGAGPWNAPVAGGGVLVRWPDVVTAVAPDLAGHVRAVRFDPETGQLGVVPAAPAYGTKLRRSTPKVVAHANQAVPGAAVTTVHVLAPGSMTASAASAAGPAPAAGDGAETSALTGKRASEGYRRVLAAHQAALSARTADPEVPTDTGRHNASPRMQEPGVR